MFEDAVMFCDNFSYLLVAFSNGKILIGGSEKRLLIVFANNEDSNMAVNQYCTV